MKGMIPMSNELTCKSCGVHITNWKCNPNNDGTVICFQCTKKLMLSMIKSMVPDMEVNHNESG